MGLFVNDAEKFPQDTPMQIWIGGERINGQFNGNFFSISERGAPIYTGTVTALGVDCQHLVDSALTGPDGTWVGYYILFTTPDGTMQRKIIQSYDSATHTHRLRHAERLRLRQPARSLADHVDRRHVHRTTATRTRCRSARRTRSAATWPTHRLRLEGLLARSNYTYVVNDAPSKTVYYVEGYGHPLILWINGQIWTTPTEWYFALDPSLYTINRTTRRPVRAAR